MGEHTVVSFWVRAKDAFRFSVCLSPKYLPHRSPPRETLYHGNVPWYPVWCCLQVVDSKMGINLQFFCEQLQHSSMSFALSQLPVAGEITLDVLVWSLPLWDEVFNAALNNSIPLENLAVLTATNENN